MYTEESLEKLNEAIEAAKAVEADGEAAQAEVDSQVKALKEAMDSLEKKDTPADPEKPADKATLSNAIRKAEDESEKTDVYTEESLEKLNEAIEAAKAVEADEDATQAEVDSQVKALKAAMDSLEKKDTPIGPEEPAESEYRTIRIRVTRAPDKTEYQVGDDLDPTGLEVEAVQKATAGNASREKKIPVDELEFDPDSFEEEGETKVTVFYREADEEGGEKEFTASFNVKVTEYLDEDNSYVDRIHIKRKPKKLVYLADEEFDPEGLTVEVIRRSLTSSKTVREDISLDELSYNYDFSQAGGPVTAGTWNKDEKGWRFKTTTGNDVIGKWILAEWNGSFQWYLFDKDGYMMTGWTEWEGNQYYLHPVSDGKKGQMYTGWHEIDGTWYFFQEISDGKRGALLKNTTTPDGYQVDEKGAWVK